MPDKEPSYSIAPTTDIVVIRDGVLGRMGSLMRWGLILYWSKDMKNLPPLHTIRCEAIPATPLARKAVRQQRCLIPASGFYGSQLKADGTKQFFYIRAKNGRPFSFAGIWASVINSKGEQINSCSIITIPNNSLKQTIQPRMPAILPSQEWGAWLNPKHQDGKALLAILKQYDPEQMEAWPILSTRDVAKIEG
ncbi:SOS response-associated peptidase [Nitrosospira sp. Is2]|uniref:SOS response-associated peptidase n=1 Tax=Nitrosospira sp. Is2 TaxID=3080532 RepID=UPI0029534507|nr:SOS response-associated peptidase [Nitrosospira sp. Is2]WON75142.1 SOS response-associated peptidase [Nitrosospira sp. Is2]